MKTAMLASNDFVGISFWLISMAMLASTVFFFIERNSVKASWRTSITISGLVTGIAFVHYMYMREVWVSTGTSPTVYRYIDWLLTVPLLMIEFYFILSAVKKVSSGIFWRLLVGSLVMLIGGYLGEAGYINITAGFVIGMAGWIYILYEIFSGEAAKEAAKLKGPVNGCFNFCKWVVTLGWSIYPLGYLFGYMIGGTDEASLNIIYNLADLLNKTIFGLVIYQTAKNLTPAGK
ncbi:bacteriorhodopsin-like [Pelagibacteraceae bacterium]|jgi:bacteriorhodopsin|nr:bacteriorhodopsin-like [Candidatus Pelagibacter sp. IMCC9063]AEA81368.1 proteorhodopsin [Candidatus Pelagibacter sp. IMCC9063]MDB4022887.1 bacteriorhodopsin-like [Pelagibacteraceae bacterium]|tara:strand:+ start:142 stop:840 length:699 start_codon:yes stop_codon:yes gene_type:complete